MQLSEDGKYMWNGTEWIPVQQSPTFPQPAPQVIGGYAPAGGAVHQQVHGFPQQNQGMMLLNVEAPSKRIVPWIGVALIVFSMLMPYVALGPFSINGFEVMGSVAEILSMGSETSSDDIEDSDLGFTGIMMVIAAFMFGLSPFFYLLSAIIAGIMLVMKKQPKVLGIIHLAYFGIFMTCAVLGAIDLGELGSFSLLDFLGIGFYLSSLSAILFFVNK